jgi:hypothetical protein
MMAVERRRRGREKLSVVKLERAEGREEEKLLGWWLWLFLHYCGLLEFEPFQSR